MQFNGQSYSHNQQAKVGVLICNLGTPAAPTKQALRPYLKQFLSDPRVVEIPRLIWWFILNVIILNIRPAKSAKAYQQVWTERGSPLAFHTADQAKKLGEHLQAAYGDRVQVDWAMRYGQPSIESRIQQFLDAGVEKLLVLPLYPQYSASTTASTFDALAADFKQRRWLPQLRFVTQYHDHPAYIQAVADSVRAYREVHGSADKLIFSYHGVPLRYLHKGDPYHCQCLKTSRLVAENLGLNDSDVITSFQSRFGRAQWLQPYTDATLKSLPASGVESVQVICPGFSSDCLETIEEIGDENRGYFLEAGGQSFAYIPALNASESHIQFLARLVGEQTQGWLDQPEETLEQRNMRAKRAQGCPHNQPSKPL
ncbi:ferrochelatase [Teredinibacter waterburyi]|uniref:ferrochelatase n=1 Tax=Teredinibacter waterburyi TaxID=1500538 RepID=UPI00165F088C|nr:ferrochelatase [Teredinibacter waterburyi]